MELNKTNEAIDRNVSKQVQNSHNTDFTWQRIQMMQKDAEMSASTSTDPRAESLKALAKRDERTAPSSEIPLTGDRLRSASPTRSASDTQEKHKYLDHLRMVGKKKPLGYLPIDTITKVCNETPENIRKEAKSRELSVLCFRDGYIKSGALYVYDKKALGELLQKNSSTLKEAGWPTDPYDFVWKVHSVKAPSKTKLFDVIADAFADDTNLGRTDVLLRERRE